MFCVLSVPCPVSLSNSWSWSGLWYARRCVEDVGRWNWQTGISRPPPEGLGGPWAWARRQSTSVCMWPLTVKCLPRLLIPFSATWMTGYSGQEKIALTSCDSGEVNHIGTWPLNTQGAGSNLRGWLGAPLSSLVISWLLSWTSCPSFFDKLCLKEWWAVCH